jgi:solute:Na+ symporter, SSS family
LRSSVEILPESSVPTLSRENSPVAIRRFCGIPAFPEDLSLQPIDWFLALAPIALMLGLALYTRRYVRSVADFLAGGRVAGRYLIANAFGESASGVANTMSKFEIFMIAGFTVTFWQALSTPVILLVAASGFVVYRYRETRALTLAQFFEMRYSRRFRLFMGMLAFGAGILNYGIFPAVGSKFFVYFLGLPESFPLLGFTVPTFVAIMAAYLSCVVMMLTVGGQITLMVTDCVEGLISHLVLIVIVIAVFAVVSWQQIGETLASQPAGKSMIDPFNSWDVADFNLSYVVMTLLLGVYGTMALQNTQGFNAAARTPHESRMAGMLGKWRLDVRVMLLLGVTVAAFTFLHHPALVAQSASANEVLGGIADEQARKQMSIPVALKYLLPVGIKGLFLSTMVMGLLAGDCSHVHSWGSIFIQDVVLPMTKRPLTTRQHLWLLRGSVIGVACFGFVFSILFTQTHYIALWWQITNAIFISGAGAAIIGGLYWSRGTTAGAWAAVIVGSLLAFAGILANQYWPDIRAAYGPQSSLGLNLPAKFWLNGAQVAFATAAISSAVYAIVSLANGRRRSNLDQLLHRGAYADVQPEQVAAAIADGELPQSTLNQIGNTGAATRGFVSRLLGYNEHFTRRDKFVAAGLVGWTFALSMATALAFASNKLIATWSANAWANYWLIIGVIVPIVVGLVTFVWFGIGGVIDLRSFFIALKTLKRDASDDGRGGATH